MTKINSIKSLFLFFITLFVQDKLTAQTQNNVSVQPMSVNLGNSVTEKKEVNSNSSVSQISKTIYVEALSTNDSTTVAPIIFDPLTMDSKPE